MKRAGFGFVAALVIALSTAGVVGQQRPLQTTATGATAASYFPERLNWEHRRPEELGMNAALVAEAVRAATSGEISASRNLADSINESFGREPFFSLIGPSKPRAAASGMIVKNGYIVAEWGDPSSVDMTFSVTKTFLTTVVGLALQRGLIRDVNDFARDYMPPDVDLFASEHNRQIRWDHLLRQSSDWKGELWGKPDWADRPTGRSEEEQRNQPMREPGTVFEYNDVRVNVMALAALHVLRRPLPEVLREEIMEPIGASSTWRWHGYENSWVELDGQRIQSVSGGGMFINAYDMARFGYLFLRNGKWKDRQLVSETWIEMARTPGPANANYGFANWYLNHPAGQNNRKPVPTAPESSVRFVGNGNNIIYIDWEHDLVIVTRWSNALNDLVGRTIASLAPRTN
jgi:CubicO group peptidase (beta-lactamase class C family)